MKNKIVIERELLHSLYWGNQKSVEEIARICKCGKSTITRLMQNSPKKHPPCLIEPELLWALYWGNQLSAPRMAFLFEIAPQTIYHKMIKYIIPRRGQQNKKIRITIESEVLWALYWGNQFSTTKIAEIFKCGNSTILSKMKKYNIPRRTNSSSHTTFYIETEILWGLYYGEEYTDKQISKIFFCSLGTIASLRKKYKIPTLPKLKDRNPRWRGGKFPYYGCEWRGIRENKLKHTNYKSEISNKKTDIVHHIYPIKKFIDKIIELCFKEHIQHIDRKSFKVLPYTMIPKLIFSEMNKEENLVSLTIAEHNRFENVTPSFFYFIKHNNIQRT